jgi:O-antigen/teichoic acid export membrane protein
MVFVIIAYAHQGLTLWLGSVFADSGYRVLQWLALGVFMNCLAQVPFSFIQGIGKPDITTKLHVSELVLYIPALWFLVKLFGINGAAIAWSIRVAFDTMLLFWVACRLFRPFSGISKTTSLSIFVAIVCLVCIMYYPGGNPSISIFVPMLIILLTVGSKLLISVNEWSYLRNKLEVIRFIK